MLDLGSTLNIVLGFVTIVLVLSLIIQSLQNVIKRLLRMKSRQAEQSLKMLFDYALSSNPMLTKYTERKYASPVLGAVVSKISKLKGEVSIGDTLLNDVKLEVLKIGRKSFWGNALLDSISKEDLTRILNVLENPNFGGKERQEAIGKVEEWYDTVMPGLAERYERGMKWMAVLLSALVVFFFNANAIEIFRYVASDTAVQQQLIDYAQSRIKANQQAGEAELKEEISKIRTLTSDYRKFGLTPFDWTDLKDHTRSTLLGWLVMTLLLSLGAPFWQDALESLFSLKNTLRKKSKPEQSAT